MEMYLKCGAHIGMRVRTKDMKRFIFRIRQDGLAVIDVKKIDERIKIAAKFLAKFNKIMVVARRPSAHKAVTAFANAIDAKAITGRFLPGTLTNPNFEEYFEPEVVIVSDPIADRQAVKEAVKMHLPVVALYDTCNVARNVDLIIPCNNRGRRAVGIVYYTLAENILKERGVEKELKLEDFGVKVTQ